MHRLDQRAGRREQPSRRFVSGTFTHSPPEVADLILIEKASLAAVCSCYDINFSATLKSVLTEARTNPKAHHSDVCEPGNSITE